MEILDCHVHTSLQTDMERLTDFLEKSGIGFANIVACSHSKAISLAPWALLAKKKSPSKYYVFSAPDLSGFYLNQENLGEYFKENAKVLLDMGCDGIKLLEGKPQARKMIPVPDFDQKVWEPFFSFAEESRLPILWHVNDPEEFWDKENAPEFAKSQGWLYDESYINNEEQYRQVLTVLERHPKLNICFAHFLFFSRQLERLSKILDRYPNVMIDLTPGIEMYENFSNNIEESKAFFEKYEKRILFGTDIGGRCVLMGEEKSFDELENTRRPKIVRTFLEDEGEILIESDGHYIIGRPSFTLKCLGLRKAYLEDIYQNNFRRFAGANPRRLNNDKVVEYCNYLKKRAKMLGTYSQEAIDSMLERY